MLHAVLSAVPRNREISWKAPTEFRIYLLTCHVFFLNMFLINYFNENTSFYLDVLGSWVCSHSELWNYGSYRQLVGLLGGGDQSVSRRLPTQNTNTGRKMTSMSRVGFEPTIPVFERMKTLLALDRAAATVSGKNAYTMWDFPLNLQNTTNILYPSSLKAGLKFNFHSLPWTVQKLYLLLLFGYIHALQKYPSH
jgi:hypothetical protein